jgi:DHA1 family multidrug resistance protein-like MFS transporter
MDKGLLPILLTVFLLAFGMSFVAPLIPLLLKDIGASSATIGQIATTYFLSFTVTTFFLGRWIEQVGSKKMIILGLFIFGLAIFIMPFMPSPMFFYLIRIFQGVGSALLFAPTETAINILSSPSKRASNMGLYGVVFAVGFAAGPGIGSWLYSLAITAPFIFAAVSCFSAILVLLVGFDETPVPVKKTEGKTLQLLKVLKIPLTAAACYAVVEVAIGSFLSLYLDELGITGGALGIVFTFFAVGGALSPYPAGKIADVWGKQPVLKVSGLLLVVVTIAFNFFQNYWALCSMAFGVGVVAGALYPVALALIGEIIPPEKMGTANASFSFAYGVGCIVGPLLTGWVLELFSIRYLFYPMTASAILFVIVTLLDRPQSISYRSKE